MQSQSVALGGDLGGTSTRILVVSGDGRVLGVGTAGGGNPTTDPAGAAAAFGAALRDALAGIDPSRVSTSVIGVAGGAALRRPAAGTHFDRVWADAHLMCDPGFVTDLEVAFAGGTPSPDGAVVVAGTGAAAGCLTGNRLTRTADGHGWLLGDDGSGFWLGREAVRATLRTIDAGESLGPLATSVLQQLDDVPTQRSGAPTRQRDVVIHAVNIRPGVQLSALAPLVSAAYVAGDPAARSIVERAAGALTATLGLIREPGEDTPIVLAGSLTATTSPVGTLLRELLAEKFAGDLLPARDGVGGAAWLALAALDSALATPETHARLVTDARGPTTPL